MIKLFNIYILCILLIGTIFNCSGKINDFNQINDWTEKHRKLAIEEFLKLAGEEYKDYFYVSFKLDSSVKTENRISDYISNHIFLPGFIKKSLIEKKEIFMMTMEEFLLIKSSTIHKLQIVVPLTRPNEIHVGYKKFYNSSSRAFSGGDIWIFKHGFLWIYGTL